MEKEGTILEERACPYEGTWYHHGEELSIDGIDIVCLNGRWEENISKSERYPTT